MRKPWEWPAQFSWGLQINSWLGVRSLALPLNRPSSNFWRILCRLWPDPILSATSKRTLGGVYRPCGADWVGSYRKLDSLQCAQREVRWRLPILETCRQRQSVVFLWCSLLEGINRVRYSVPHGPNVDSLPNQRAVPKRVSPAEPNTKTVGGIRRSFLFDFPAACHVGFSCMGILTLKVKPHLGVRPW